MTNNGAAGPTRIPTERYISAEWMAKEQENVWPRTWPAESADNPIRQIGHELELSFYSEDGQVVGLSSTNSRLLRGHVLPGGGEHRTAYFEGAEQFDAVLLLEDGNWRVQHWVRTGIDGRWWNEPLSDPVPSVEFDTSVAAVSGQQAFGNIAHVVFDPSLDPDRRAEYLAAETNAANTVRLQVGFTAESMQSQLDEWLDDLADRGLMIVVSLFHDHRDHRPEVWDADDRHLATLVPITAAHPAVVLYDLRFAADEDVDDVVDRDLLDAWLAHVGTTVRSLDSETPLTIGWSSVEAALAAPGIEDVVTFVTENAGVDAQVVRERQADRVVIGLTPRM